MTLEAIILRFEGVVFPTGEAFRLATNDVLAEAGFNHEVDRETFALQFGHYICKERFLDYAAQFLRRRRPTEDLATLLEIAYRRIVVTAEHALAANAPAARDSVRELAAAARQDNVRLAVITSISLDTARRLVPGLGTDIPVYGPTRTKNGWTGSALERSKDALANALAGLAVLPRQCLVLQSSSYGLAAAEYAGVPAIALIDQSALNGGVYRARAVADDLLELTQGKPAADTQNRGNSIIQRLRDLHDTSRQSRAGAANDIMLVRDVLKDKGSTVKSVYPNDPVEFVAKRLWDENIGAMVAVSANGTLEGIVSERDVMRGLETHGHNVLSMPVSNIMTRAVITCSPSDSVHDVAKVMTNRRIRHLPVTDRGNVIGLISIGDVLNQRLEEVRLEAGALRSATIAQR